MLIAALVPIFTSSTVLGYLYQNQSIFLSDHSTFFIYFTLISSITIATALTPSTLIAILSGYFLNWLGILSILISYPIACALGLAISKKIISFLKINNSDTVPEYQKIFHGLQKHEFAFIAYLRISPIMPFAMINIFLASFKIKWSNYIFGSMLGMLPRTMFFFYIGTKIEKIWFYLLNNKENSDDSIIFITLSIISLIGLISILKKILNSINSN